MINLLGILIIIGLLFYIIKENKSKYKKSQYKSSWKELSLYVRNKANWHCERCNINLSKHKHLLHTHHIDLNIRNNSFSNLQALCIKCHSNMPGGRHKDLKNTPAYKEYLNLI